MGNMCVCMVCTADMWSEQLDMYTPREGLAQDALNAVYTHVHTQECETC